jgi:hypothetical protein
MGSQSFFYHCLLVAISQRRRNKRPVESYQSIIFLCRSLIIYL